MKHKSWIHKQSPLEDLLKNKKEECYINTRKDPMAIHKYSIPNINTIGRVEMSQNREQRMI